MLLLTFPNEMEKVLFAECRQTEPFVIISYFLE
jgi:hypothetical protein